VSVGWSVWEHRVDESDSRGVSNKPALVLKPGGNGGVTISCSASLFLLLSSGRHLAPLATNTTSPAETTTTLNGKQEPTCAPPPVPPQVRKLDLFIRGWQRLQQKYSSSPPPPSPPRRRGKSGQQAPGCLLLSCVCRRGERGTACMCFGTITCRAFPRSVF